MCNQQKLDQMISENNQKVKEVNDILVSLKTLHAHQAIHKKDFKVKIKILKLTHRQKILKRYIKRKYNISL